MSEKPRVAKGKKCKYCKAPDPVVHGLPPDPCEAECKKCKKRWPVCGARKKDGPDMRAPMAGSNRCRWDGGLSPGAPIKHGRRSKFMPTDLALKALAAEEDPDLVSIRWEIATVEALIDTEWEKLRDDKPSEDWTRAQALMAEVTASIGEGDEKKMALALGQLSQLITSGRSYESRVRLILDLIERLKRLKESEIRRMAALSLYVLPQALAAAIAGIRIAIMEEVSDPNDRARLSKRVRALAVGATETGERT